VNLANNNPNNSTSGGKTAPTALH